MPHEQKLEEGSELRIKCMCNMELMLKLSFVEGFIFSLMQTYDGVHIIVSEFVCTDIQKKWLATTVSHSLLHLASCTNSQY